MCEQESVLTTILAMSKNGGVSKANLLVIEAQIKDYKRMDKRMKSVEEKVGNLEVKFDAMDVKVDRVLELLEKKHDCKWDLFIQLAKNHWFWLWLIILTALVLGATLGELGSVIKTTFTFS